MNRLPSFVRQHLVGLRVLLLFTVITGIIYPLVMTGIAQVLFKNQANGSLVSYKGRVVGSSLLCQEFVNAKGNPLPQYFQSRPSFAIVDWELGTAKNGQYVVEGTGPSNYGCNPLYSAASNLG
jgi:K+-transporting ATPase c subunit